MHDITHNFVYTPDQENGFTLLELLVAMLMVSMVTVIISVAFRLGLNAWDRMQREGDRFQVRTVIPTLLEKQLDAIVREKRISSGQGPIKLPFTGREIGLSFFTTHAAMSGNHQGLLRVTYLYDEQSASLMLFQQLILKPDDLDESRFPLSKSWDGELAPSGKIDGITRFSVRYSQESSSGRIDPDEMVSFWEPDNPQNYPESILLEFSMGIGPATGVDMKDSSSELWHYTVGMK